MKIRNKTSLWIALVALLMGVLSGYIVFIEMKEEAVEQVDRELFDLSERFFSDLSGDDRRALDTKASPEGYFVKITNESGVSVYQSSLAQKIAFDVPQGASRFFVTIDIPYDLIWHNPDHEDDVGDSKGNGVLFRVITEEKSLNGQTLSSIMAKPSPFSTEDLKEVREQIVIWSIMAALLVICLSYLLAGRILLPLKNINSQIRDINQNSLSRRIPTGKSKDELHELTLSLNSMFDRIQDSFEKQREFIGNAAHEIKTPITTLLLSYENMLSKSLPNELRDNLESQQDTLRRVSMLVKNLLDISRLEQRDSLQYDDFDLAELTDKVICDFQEIIEDSQIELHIITDKVEYFGDKLKIQRMLVNLLDNAIKYNQTHGTIGISLNKSNKFVTIEISNSSAPIPPEDCAKIFDQFYRVDTSHSSQTGGVGLGLAIVKRIVELHEGIISVSSESNITTFKITLPIRQI